VNGRRWTPRPRFRLQERFDGAGESLERSLGSGWLPEPRHARGGVRRRVRGGPSRAHARHAMRFLFGCTGDPDCRQNAERRVGGRWPPRRSLNQGRGEISGHVGPPVCRWSEIRGPHKVPGFECVGICFCRDHGKDTIRNLAVPVNPNSIKVSAGRHARPTVLATSGTH
jgi:hypothetical protein